MSLEGGGRFESFPSFDAEFSIEKQRDTESGINSRSEAGVEGSWLLAYINPEKLARLREYPALAEHSDEWIIMESLLGQLVEGGPEMDPSQKARLRNLVGVLRLAFYPNMRSNEQKFLYDLVTKTTTVDFSSLTYDVNEDIKEDMVWLRETFSLDLPSQSLLRSSDVLHNPDQSEV